jgi:hypothetical protein
LACLLETIGNSVHRGLALTFVRRVQIKTLSQLKWLARKSDLHLAIAQESGTLAPLAFVNHRTDIHGIEEAVLANGAQRVELWPFPCQAFGESHEMDDAELEIGLPGVFHARSGWFELDENELGDDVAALKRTASHEGWPTRLLQRGSRICNYRST